MQSVQDVEKHVPVREGDYGERVATVEPGGVEYISLKERHGKPIDLFWTWLSPNLEFATVYVGVLGVAVFAIGVLLAGFLPSKATLVFTYVAAGVGSVLSMAHWLSLRQRRFPVRLLGRVTMATRMVLFGVMPIAYVAGGALARSQGSQTLFVVAGCVGLATCLWAWAVGLGSLRVDDAVQ